MTIIHPRSNEEKILYEEIYTQIVADGQVSESNWEAVALKRFNAELTHRLVREKERPLIDALGREGVDIDSLVELSGVGAPKFDHVIHLLVKELNDDHLPSTLNRIVRALSCAGGSVGQIAPMMVDMFASSEHVHIRDSVGQFLGYHASASELSDILKFLSDTSYGGARCELVDAVARIMGKGATPLLIDLLSDDYVFNYAIENLGKLKAKEAVPHIEPFLKYKEGYTRQRAKQAIRKCSAKPKHRSQLPPRSNLESLGNTQLFELSVGFDLLHLAPFLRAINKKFKLGLPVAAMVEFAELLDIGDEQGMTLDVPYRKEKVGLHYRIEKDDLDVCGLFLYAASKSLIENMIEELNRYMAKQDC